MCGLPLECGPPPRSHTPNKDWATTSNHQLCVSCLQVSVLTCMLPHVCVQVYMHKYMWACRTQRLTSSVFLNCCLHYLLRQAILQTQSLPIPNSQASQIAPGILCVHFLRTGLQVAAAGACFCGGSGDPNCGPQPRTASVSHPLSHLPIPVSGYFKSVDAWITLRVTKTVR